MKQHKKLIAIIMSVVLIMTIVPIALFASAADVYEPFVDSDGNAKTGVGNYYITSASDLQKLSAQVKKGTNYGSSSFKMTNNIDMTDVTWTPIGTAAYPFESEFDGNGFYISNLSISDASTNSDGTVKYSGGNGGVFGYVSGTVKNVHVKDFDYSFGGLLVHVGGIAANLTGTGTITNCSTTDGKITLKYEETAFTTNYVGGIVGSSSGLVEKSFSTAEILVDAYFSLGNSVGGVVGQSSGKVANTYFVGNVVMGDALRGAVGGIVGTAYEGTISNSYNVGIVGGNYTAGIVGTKGDDAIITNCYYCEDSAEAGYLVKEGEELVAHNENTTLFTVASPVTATNLGDAFRESTLLSRYKFPELKNNIDTPAAVANTTEFAGGNGSLYSPFEISNVTHLNNVRNHLGAAFVLKNDIVAYDYMYATKDENLEHISENVDSSQLDEIKGDLGIDTPFDISDLKDKLANNAIVGAIKDRLGIANDDALLDGILVGGFKPIGSTAEPFSGIFDGAGHSISNIQINGTNTYNALFVSNYGTIKNFTLTSTFNDGSTDYSVKATKTALVNVTAPTDKVATVAAVVATNDGNVKNVTTDVDITVTTSNFKAHAAGVVADNFGIVDGCKNTGVILIKYTDDAFDNVSLLDVATSADLIAGGVVAVNENGSTVKNSMSSNSARSELTSASPDDGIYEAAIVAKDLNKATTTGNSTTTSAKPYLNYVLPEAYASVETPYAIGTNEPADIKSGATVENATGDVTATPVYGEESENYQPVTITFQDSATEPNTFRTTFLAWVRLDPNDITVHSQDAKKSFLVGDDFKTTGLSVVVKEGESGEYNLKEVASSADNGYTAKVFNSSSVDVTSTFSSQPEGTYTVKLYYAGNEIPAGSTYQIKIYDVASIEVGSDYPAYMVGQKPSLYVRAEYADPDRTAKELKTYDYYICNSEADVAGATEANGTFTETGDKYVGVKYTKAGGAGVVTSAEAAEVKVLPNDVKVTNLAAKTSADDGSNVRADSIQLNWTDNYATKYKIERAETADGTFKTISSSTKTTVTDNSSVAGTEYTYRVTMYVAGEPSTGSVTITVTAPMPESVVAKVDKATKYIALGQPFTTGSMTVEAKYKNGTYENLKSSSTDDATATTKYYVDSSAFNTNAPGTYPIVVKYMGSTTYKEQEVGKYNVEVVPPTAIAAEAKYSAYPVGYSVEALKNAIDVEASYDPVKIKKTYPVEAEKFNISGYTPSATPGSVDLTITHVPYVGAATLSTHLTVKFVPNVPPTEVTATAGNTGINTVTWSEVDGAVSYNIYRDDGTEAKKIASVKNALSYNDEKAAPGATYTYSVSAVIADQETAKTSASAVTTVSPIAIIADATSARKDYAVGQNLSVLGLKVDAKYEGTDETRALAYNQTSGDFNYYISTTYDKNSAGTYDVSVTYKGSTSFNGAEIGHYSVNVYPVYKLTVTMKKASYPVGYPLSSSDFTVKAVYGKEGTDVKTTTIDEYEVIAEPNMNVTGQQSITVKYGDLTATATFNVYDTAAQIEEKPSSGYTQEQSGKYLNKVAAGTSVSKLKNNLENNNTDLKVFKSDGQTQVTSGNVGTGYVVKLYSAGTVVDSIIVVVTGDVNGDAKISAGDYVAIKNHIMGDKKVTGCYKLAADANGDGNVKATDYVKVKNIIMGR